MSTDISTVIPGIPFNTDTSTQVRGAIVGLASAASLFFPQYATPIVQGAGALYSIFALLKPYLPRPVAPPGTGMLPVTVAPTVTATIPVTVKPPVSVPVPEVTPVTVGNVTMDQIVGALGNVIALLKAYTPPLPPAPPVS